MGMSVMETIAQDAVATSFTVMGTAIATVTVLVTWYAVLTTVENFEAVTDGVTKIQTDGMLAMTAARNVCVCA